jgi:galactoside 2-L-fucosyltransferase 1/2
MQKRNRYKNLTKFYQGPMAPVCSKTIVPTIELEEIGYGIYTKLSSFSLCPNNHALSVGGGVEQKCAIVLREYLMSYRYFHHVQAEIRHMFDLRRGLRQHQRDSFLLHLRSPVIMKQQQQTEKVEVILVGIHIRKTDMARDSAFRDPPIRYYQDAMNYFRSKYETRHQMVTFVLASDNIAWCQRQKIFQNVTVIPTNIDAFVSMAILRYCDHMILSLGTFGWWAAYLGGGDAVYWNHAFDMNHSKHKGKIALEDYYLPHWIGLE